MLSLTSIASLLLLSSASFAHVSNTERNLAVKTHQELLRRGHAAIASDEQWERSLASHVQPAVANKAKRARVFGKRDAVLVADAVIQVLAKASGSDTVYTSTAVWYENGGHISSCKTYNSDDEATIGLSTDFWADPNVLSDLCGRKVTLTNTANGKTINAVVGDTSGKAEYITVSKSAFAALAVLDDGIFPLSFSFVDELTSDKTPALAVSSFTRAAASPTRTSSRNVATTKTKASRTYTRTRTSLSLAPTPSAPSERSGNFPLGTSSFPTSGAPSLSRANWWAPDSELYGFLGFSYPMAVTDCGDATNQFDKINRDFAKMKSFGATMVRVYAPQCRSVSVWETLVRAGVAQKMGVIVQVWWGFGDQELWRQTQASIYQLFTSSSYAAVAPYVVHSASFGSEPIGDGVGGGNFVADLKSFKTKMNSFGIPVGISEDWDRPGRMSGSDGSGLGYMGSQIKANTDQVHAHIMPYYHADVAPLASDGWDYTVKQLAYLRKTLDQPIFVTESQWSSQQGGSHGRGYRDDQVSMEGFKTYWTAFLNNCSTFKKYRAGWFVHTFDDSQELGFGMFDNSGNIKMDFKPQRC